MADENMWSSLITNVLPAVVGGLMGARGGSGLGAIPGALYGLSAGTRSGMEADQEREKIARDTAYKNQQIQFEQQRLDLSRLDALPKVFQVGQHLSENLSEEDRATVVPQFGQLLRDAGVGLDDKAVGSLLSDKSRLEFMTTMYGDVTKNLQPQDKLRLSTILSKDPAKADKLMGQYAFAQAQQIRAAGGDIPDRILGMLDDDQRLQVGAKPKAILLEEMKQDLGLGGEGPSVGPDRQALAMEMGFKNFAMMPKNKQAEVNKEVKRREDERLALESGKQDRLSNQFLANMSLQERRITLQDEQQRRLLPSQQKVLTTNRVAIAAIDDYGKAHEDFLKEGRGTLSDVFRGAIAKNKNAQRASDFVTAEGRTPAEKQLAAKYNALVGNIRSLTDEVGVLTDVDAVRILGSFDPAQDRAQVRANLSARRNTHQRVYDTSIEDYQSLGKDISRFVKPPAPAGSKPTPAGGGWSIRPK